VALSCWSIAVLNALLVWGSWWVALQVPFIVGWWITPNLVYWLFGRWSSPFLRDYSRRVSRGVGRILRDWIIGEPSD
jgi:hypothetical protein